MTWAPWLAAYLMAAPVSRCQVPAPARLGILMDRIRAAGARPTVPAGLLPPGSDLGPARRGCFGGRGGPGELGV
jgi:hypothetical protein